MDEGRIAELVRGLGSDWTVVGAHLTRTYPFPDFKSGLAFVDEVGRRAEELNHHPLVELTWGRVRLELWTHTTGGVTARDIELARQSDEAYGRVRPV